MSRQIKILAGFSGQRACDRRIKKLVDVGYIKKKHFIYGVPYLYFATPLAKRVFNLDFLTTNVRIEQIQHDIAVIDTAIFFVHMMKVDKSSITTERQLKNQSGFGASKHVPDFVFESYNTKIAVEIEINIKSLSTFQTNVKNNFLNYEQQFWIIPKSKKKIYDRLQSLSADFPNIKTLFLEDVIEYVKKI